MKRATTLLALCFALLHTHAAWTQPAWPSKPIRLIVAYSTGGIGDQLARLIGDQLGRDLNVPVVVENRAGAGGMIGASACKAARPDGHTYCVFLMDVVTVHSVLFENVPYTAETDFVPVSLLASTNTLLVVPGNSDIRTIADLIQKAKTQSNKTNWGSWGVGSTAHLVHRLLEKTFAIEIAHIPYNSTPALVSAVRTGEVDATILGYSLVAGQAAEGDVRAIATLGTERFSFMPDVPTLVEQGVPLDATGWYGLFAPAATPMASVTRMNAAVNRAIDTLTANGKFDPQWYTTRAFSQTEFADFVRQEAVTWGDVAVQSGVKLN